MKKALLFFGVIAGLLLPKLSSAQNYPYTFSSSTGATYTPLSENATEIIGASGWDDSVIAATIPFDFDFWGTPAHDIYVDLSGGIDYEENPLSRILGFYTDYMDRGNSTVTMETTGTTPSRIAKIQFKNAGFYADTTSAMIDSANFQIWLYETSGTIEYHAGSSYTNDVVFDMDNNPLYSGLIYTLNGLTNPTAIDTFHFVGNVNNAPKDSVLTFSLNDGPSDPALAFINYGKFPASGTVFKFAKPQAPSGVHDVKQLTFSLYPNPAKENIVLNLPEMPAKNAVFQIMDVSGKVVASQNIVGKTTSINVSQLPAGFYYGGFSDDKHNGQAKFVKQ